MPLPDDEFVSPQNAFRFNDPEAQATQRAFFALNIVGGQILVPILIIATFVRRNAYSRSLLFLNFCFCWVAYSLSFLLLFYSGEYQGPNQPGLGLCSIQAVMVYITQVWTVSAFLVMPVHLWLTARSLGAGSDNHDTPTRRRSMTLVLFAFPYVVATIYAIAAIIVAISNQDKVGLIYLFCSIDHSPIRMAVSSYAIVGIPIALLIHADTGRLLYKHHRALKQVRVNGSSFTSLFVRMGLFGLWAFGGVIAGILAISNNSFKGPRQLIQASLPLGVFIFFGSNPGIWKADPTTAPIKIEPMKAKTVIKDGVTISKHSNYSADTLV